MLTRGPVIAPCHPIGQDTSAAWAAQTAGSGRSVDGSARSRSSPPPRRGEIALESWTPQTTRLSPNALPRARVGVARSGTAQASSVAHVQPSVVCPEG